MFCRVSTTHPQQQKQVDQNHQDWVRHQHRSPVMHEHPAVVQGLAWWHQLREFIPQNDRIKYVYTSQVGEGSLYYPNMPRIPTDTHSVVIPGFHSGYYHVVVRLRCSSKWPFKNPSIGSGFVQTYGNKNHWNSFWVRTRTTCYEYFMSHHVYEELLPKKNGAAFFWVT